MTGWRAPAAYLGAGLAAALLCLVELQRTVFVADTNAFVTVLFLALLAGAVGSARPAPAVALLLAWGVAWVQLLGRVPLLLTEAALAFVVFACARWGRAATVALSAVSILVLPVLGLGWTSVFGVEIGSGLLVFVRTLRFELLLVGAVAVLAVPWLTGLALRFRDRAHVEEQARGQAEQSAEQAQEIARLREEQNRLARDVHDVVGHSLAVILAQAESAQFVGDDPDRLRQTMATIASSARASLQDVRHVLSSSSASPGGSAAEGVRGLDSLLDGVRAAGHDVEVSVVGQPRPLPPELETAAYRVVQEMLTNAMKHGARELPIRVERHWPEPGGFGDTLRLEVCNATASAGTSDTAPTPPGRGLDGMRRRLESVGGHLDVRRREHGPTCTFTVTAWLPIRDPGRAPTTDPGAARG